MGVGGSWLWTRRFPEAPSHFSDSVVYPRKSHKMGRERIDSLQASCWISKQKLLILSAIQKHLTKNEQFAASCSSQILRYPKILLTRWRPLNSAVSSVKCSQLLPAMLNKTDFLSVFCDCKQHSNMSLNSAELHDQATAFHRASSLLDCLFV